MTAIDEDAVLELVVALHRLLRSLRRAAPAGVHSTQLIVLGLLTELGPCRIGVLADRIPCSQPTATAAVMDMETAGLVRRDPDPADGRASKVAITAAGNQALIRLGRMEAEVLTERLGSLPLDEAERVLAVRGVLRQLAEN